MHIGKLISLSEAAKQLSKKDNGDISLTWTLRFCLNEYVKFAIKVPFEVNAWEWKEELDIGESCGNCVEIADQREELMMQDGKDGKILDETNLPQYCENCCMTGVRHRTGLGDFIRSRTGVFFLLHSDIEYLTDFDNKEVTCYKLYVENSDWKNGYMQVEAASAREKCCWQWTYDQSADLNDSDYKFNELLKEQCDEESNDRDLIVKRKGIHIWREDFENALADIGYEERKGNTIIERKSATTLERSYYQKLSEKMKKRVDVIERVIIESGYTKYGDSEKGKIEEKCRKEY